jgi:hypothetical protein
MRHIGLSIQARVDQSTSEICYGFAKYLRDGLPNASFSGLRKHRSEGREHVRRFLRRSVVRVALDALSFPMGEPKIDAGIEELIEDDAKAEQSPSNGSRWLTTRAPRGGARWSEAGRPLGAPDRGVKSIIRRSRAARSRARAGARSRTPPALEERQVDSGRIELLAHRPRTAQRKCAADNRAPRKSNLRVITQRRIFLARIGQIRSLSVV